MSTITKNYKDAGFGNPTIDLDTLPFSNMENKEVSYVGFGNKVLSVDGNDYINNRDFNFGSKKVEVSKNLAKYEYELIHERGQALIEPKGFVDVKIKNPLIDDPTFVCSPVKEKSIEDVPISTERTNSRAFKVYNESNKNIKVDYIATKMNAKKTPVQHDITDILIKNKIISKSLIEIPVVAPRFNSPSNTYNINLMNYGDPPHSGYPPGSGNLVIDANHNLLILYNMGISGNFPLPTNLNINNYLTFHTQTLSEAQLEISNFATFSNINISSQTQLYSLSNPDDSTTKTSEVNGAFGYTYGIELSEDMTYYFWYDSNDTSWYLSTQRFPNITTYM